MEKTKKRKRKSQWVAVGKRFLKNKAALGGLIVIIILILSAIFADVITPEGMDDQDLGRRFQTPSSRHLLGTDNLGRDQLTRIVYGTRTSLQIGFIVVTISMLIGSLIGAVAGFYGGMVDNGIMRIVDILLSIPQILLAIAIVSALGPGMTNLMIAVGVSAIPGYARLVRGAALSIREQEFMEAARAIGGNDFRLIMRHLLPNCAAPIIVQATMGLASAILNAAGLSFIGLGVMPPTAEWGSMLNVGRRYLMDYWHMTVFPGLAIVIVVLAFNLVGDGLRDALDPKLKR
jgi:peptide/nickel transport system permease protein